MRVTRALAILRVDPAGLGGLWLRARAGPLRAAVLAALAPMGATRLHPSMDDATLMGATDLTATLAEGKIVRAPGLLERVGPFTLAMAERCPPGLAARLAQRLDGGGAALIALDEAAGAGEGLPEALVDRLGLFVDLDGFIWSETDPIDLEEAGLALARARLPRIATPPGAAEALTRAAHELGIDSLRAPGLALRCARAAAALRGADAVEEADLCLAAELVFAHRALPLPDAQPEPPPPAEDTPPPENSTSPSTAPPEEMLVDAARTALPPGLLDDLAAGRAARGARGSGSGAARRSHRRGRPLPARPGRPSSETRIDLVATLRAAAPWQGMRRAQFAHRPGRLCLLPADLRIRRFEERADRVLIFAVDASGSQAMARLSEAKGAVELLLARAYARRDHVALVAFRGTQAEVLLPPTRSLVQTRRRLAGLPGGGGTPLAAGLQAAMSAADLARARGLTPTIALLTDGRGNIALDGSPGRARAQEDATRLARAIAASGTPAVVIDTSILAQPALAELARAMAADCLHLPRADAGRLSTALSGALEPAR